MQEYFTIKNSVAVETTIERSRFIASVAPVKSEEEAKAFVDSIRKKFPDATHNCYAYIAERGAYSRYSDDGEPSGTAGPPILDVIKNNSLLDTAIVVTRYFGGIKLGTGGLTRAYGGVAAQGVTQAGIVKMSVALNCFVDLSYADYGAFSRLSRPELKVHSVEYGDGVKIAFAIKKSAYNAFNRDFCDIFSGRYELDITGEEFIGF
ncbi:MAG: YigZ family protein [Clostridia bacterium]|nr:YigZ family protein [Clostridia bacterium]